MDFSFRSIVVEACLCWLLYMNLKSCFLKNQHISIASFITLW